MRGESPFKRAEMVFSMNEHGHPNRMEVNVQSTGRPDEHAHTYAVKLGGRRCRYDSGRPLPSEEPCAIRDRGTHREGCEAIRISCEILKSIAQGEKSCTLAAPLPPMF
jgi:hypothetical protein